MTHVCDGCTHQAWDEVFSVKMSPEIRQLEIKGALVKGGLA